MGSVCKKIGLLFLLIHIVCYSDSFAQSDDEKKSIHINIDWLWGDINNGPPSKVATYVCLVPIGDGSHLGFRGSTGARSCVYYAALYAALGKKEEAVQWLIAGQDHNAQGKSQFKSYSDYAVNYTKDKYLNETIKSLNISSIDKINGELLNQIIKPDIPFTAAQVKQIPISVWKMFPDDKKIPKELLEKMSPETMAQIPSEILPYLVK